MSTPNLPPTRARRFRMSEHSLIFQAFAAINRPLHQREYRMDPKCGGDRLSARIWLRMAPAVGLPPKSRLVCASSVAAPPFVVACQGGPQRSAWRLVSPSPHRRVRLSTIPAWRPSEKPGCSPFCMTAAQSRVTSACPSRHPLPHSMRRFGTLLKQQGKLHRARWRPVWIGPKNALNDTMISEQGFRTQRSIRPIPRRLTSIA